MLVRQTCICLNAYEDNKEEHMNTHATTHTHTLSAPQRRSVLVCYYRYIIYIYIIIIILYNKYLFKEIKVVQQFWYFKCLTVKKKKKKKKEERGNCCLSPPQSFTAQTLITSSFLLSAGEF